LAATTDAVKRCSTRRSLRVSAALPREKYNVARSLLVLCAGTVVVVVVAKVVVVIGTVVVVVVGTVGNGGGGRFVRGVRSS
jgi:hypothetical protein